MEPNSRHDDLYKLVDALVDGKAGDEEIDELSRRLEIDPAARRAFIGFMCIEAELNVVFRVPTLLDSTSKPNVAADSQRSSTAAAFGSRRWMMQWLTIGATLLIAMGGSSWLTYESMRDRGMSAAKAGGNDATVPFDSPACEAVARITGTQNCRWGRNQGQHNFGYGDALCAAQRLELQSGFAEITFSSGVRVVLEGPATFEVPDDHGADLLTGRMTAAVPRGAADFTIRAPRLSINDPGTQFGLIADEVGSTEVHVFEGPVRARRVDRGGHELGSVRLISTEAARLEAEATDFAVFRANSNRFVRTLTPSLGPSSELLALEEFDYPVGPLAWQNGGFGWAGPWTDIETAEGVAGINGARSNGVTEGSLAGCEMISHGNRAEQTGEFNRIRRALSTSFCGVFDAAGLVENQDALRLIGHDDTTVYISFLQRASKMDDDYYGFELHRGDGNPNRVLGIGNGGAPGKAKYGVNSTFNMPGAQVEADYFMPLGEEDTEAHFFVIRIEFGAENHDIATVYRDPSSLINEHQCAVAARLRGNFAFDRISLGNFKGTKVHEVDEVRIGTSFSAVTTGQQTSAVNRLARFVWPSDERSLRSATTLLIQSMRRSISTQDQDSSRLVSLQTLR